MKTTIETISGSATCLDSLDEASVDLVVTSPPYPMIEMWDASFAAQDPRVAEALKSGDGIRAFESMHALLDRAWDELLRVLRPGGIACINIGDATRSLGGDFRLYPNHARVLHHLLRLGFATLPDILWRKPTNAPSKFMGSGMLPAGAYVTYEHEYILVARKGGRRKFPNRAEQCRRRQSAFFWEERNVWFSDIWCDLKGAPQQRIDETAPRRSAAFPFELAHRLICMFSIKGDTVLDPFLGTGTTLAAAVAAARNAVGVEIDAHFLQVARTLVRSSRAFANRFNRERLQRHAAFIASRTADPPRHANAHYGFPVVTSQERDLRLDQVLAIRETGEGAFAVEYS